MFYFEWDKYYRRMIGLVLLCSIFIVVVGFLVDRHQFWGNLIAECAGICLSVCIAVLLIERVSATRNSIIRRLKWKRIAYPFNTKLRSAIVELAACSLQLSGKAKSREEAVGLITYPYRDLSAQTELSQAIRKARLVHPQFSEVAVDQADELAVLAIEELTKFKKIWAEVTDKLNFLLVVTDDYDLLSNVERVDKEVEYGISSLARKETEERRALLVRNSLWAMYDAADHAARTLDLLMDREDSLYPGNETA